MPKIPLFKIAFLFLMYLALSRGFDKISAQYNANGAAAIFSYFFEGKLKQISWCPKKMGTFKLSLHRNGEVREIQSNVDVMAFCKIKAGNITNEGVQASYFEKRLVVSNVVDKTEIVLEQAKDLDLFKVNGQVFTSSDLKNLLARML